MPAAPVRPRASDEVIIAVDPHKASWTAVVVGAGLCAVATIRVEVNRSGYRSCAASRQPGRTHAGPSKQRRGWVRH